MFVTLSEIKPLLFTWADNSISCSKYRGIFLSKSAKLHETVAYRNKTSAE